MTIAEFASTHINQSILVMSYAGRYLLGFYGNNNSSIYGPLTIKKTGEFFTVGNTSVIMLYV